MPGLSFDVLRVGKKYRLINFRERYEFVIEEILEDRNFKLKDIHTLKRFICTTWSSLARVQTWIRELE